MATARRPEFCDSKKMEETSLKEKTAKGLFWGGFSNAMQQLLNLFFGIFLARLLSPADYGMVGMLTIFTLIASSLQESGFISAITNRKEVTANDYNAVFWFSLSVSVSVYILLFFLAPLIARFYNEPELVPLARFLFLGFILSSTTTAHCAYMFRNLMVKKKTVAQLSAMVVSGTVGVTAAWHGMAYWGIALQSITYIFVSSLCFWLLTPWRPSLHIDFTPIRQMFGFSSRVLATNIFIHINNNLFSVLLGRLFSVSQVGYYTQAAKWNMMGYNTINGMITGVAQPVLSRVADDRDRQRGVFRKMLRFTAFVSFPLMFGLSLIACELIVVCVTEKWLPSVPMMQMLCVWGAFVPLQGLFSNLVISSGKSRIYMWNTIVLCLLQAAVLVATASWGIETMIAFFVGLNIAWLGVWYLFARRQLALRFLDMLRDILPFAAVALVAMAAAYYASLGLESLYLRLAVKVLVAAAVYLSLMWICRAAVLRESIGFIRQRFTRNSQ